MLTKLGVPSLRIFAKFSREIASNRSILSLRKQNETISQSCFGIVTRRFCEKIDAGSERQSSPGCELNKKLLDQGSITSEDNTSYEQGCEAKPKPKDEDLNYGDNIKDKLTSSATNSKAVDNLSAGLNGQYPLVSRFQLPSDWRKGQSRAPGIKFPGEIYVIKSIQDELQYVDVLEDLLQEKVLGFDTEHCPVQHLVCVVQLASHDKAVLWQCFNFKKIMPHYLKELLVGDIKKVGHACMDDAIMISRQFKQEPKNLIDTGPWARDLHCSLQSLQGLCAIFLREHLSKTHQQSNWKKENLSPGQIRYAATDAWISLKVYEEMKRHAEELGVTLTPMYKNLQERYQEVMNSRRLKQRRRRQKIKEKKQEKKAKALTQTSESNIHVQVESADIHVQVESADIHVQVESADTSNQDMTQGTDANSEGHTISKGVNKNNITYQTVNESLNTVDSTAVNEIHKDKKDKKSIGSRQRHKRFMAKFHSLE